MAAMLTTPAIPVKPNRARISMSASQSAPVATPINSEGEKTSPNRPKPRHRAVIKIFRIKTITKEVKERKVSSNHFIDARNAKPQNSGTQLCRRYYCGCNKGKHCGESWLYWPSFAAKSVMTLIKVIMQEP